MNKLDGLTMDLESVNLVISIVPNLKQIFDYWDESNIASTSLTFVGIL